MSSAAFTLNLELQPGCCFCRVSDGINSYVADASHFLGDDVLRCLLRAAISLLSDAPVTPCSMFLEPIESRWAFQRRGDEAIIRVREFPDWSYGYPDERGTLVFEAATHVLRLARQVRAAMERLLRKHGPNGYEALWHHPFPYAECQRLSELIRIQSREGASRV